MTTPVKIGSLREAMAKLPKPRQPISWTQYRQLQQQGYSDNAIQEDGLEVPTKTADETIGDALLGGIQGISMGTSDELGGAIDAVANFREGGTLKERYVRFRNAKRQSLDEAKARSPTATAVGDFIGGALIPLPGGSIAKGAIGVLKGGGAIVQGVKTGARLGALSGALDAAGREGQSDASGISSGLDVANEALGGGIAGAKSGALIGGLGAGAVATAKNITEWTRLANQGHARLKDLVPDRFRNWLFPRPLEHARQRALAATRETDKVKRAQAQEGRLAEAQRRADLKAEFKATDAANVETARAAKLAEQETARVAKLAEQETARVAKLAEKEAALEGSAMDYNKKLDVKAAEAADRAAKQEAALIGGAMDHNKVIDTRAANAATRAAEKMEVIQGKALTEDLPEGARLNTTKFVTTNEPKPTSEEGSLVPSLRFGERPGGPVPYFPDPPPDGGGGAAVVPLPRPVVPSSPSVVTPSETLTQAQAAANQQARQQAARPRFDPETGEVLPEIPVPRGDVGANEMLIPLPKPSQTLPGAIDKVLIPGSTEADHVARLQALSPEHFDAHPNTIRQYLEMGDGTGKPTVAQNNVMHQLKKAAYQADEFAKEEAANQVPELTGLTRYWNNLPPQDHAGNAQKAVASLKEDGLEVTPKSMNARLKALGLILDPKSSGTARTTGTGPPAQSKTLGEAAEKAKVTRRDGYGRPIP